MKKFLSICCVLCCLIGNAYASSLTDRIAEATKSADKNTSASLDAISLMARADAKEPSIELAKESVAYIRSKYPHFYVDNETMEKTIYYASYLDKAYGQNTLGRLGWYTLKSVKYVYRHVEKVEDEATQASLRKVKQELDKL